MSFIQIKVKGQKEAAAAIDKVKQNLPQTRQKELTEVSNQFVKVAKSYAHVISGDMKNSIAAEVDGQSGHANVTAIDYAVYENARGGDHAFWDKAIADNQKNGIVIVKKQMDQALKSSGIPLK